MYSPDILPLLQSLLSTLADIDFAHESDLEAVQNSAAEAPLMRRFVEKLQQQHQERRAPYVQQVKALQERMKAAAA